MNARFLNILFHWLPLGATVTALSFFMYFGVQQMYRNTLNDPQVMMVEDAETALLSGKTAIDIIPKNGLFDMGKSLAPFLAVYDAKGSALAYSAHLASSTPLPPIGVLEASKQSGENRVTWQPNSTTRIALVVRPVPGKNLYVVAGRNMKETETRIDHLTDLLTIFLIATLVITFLLDLLGDIWRRRFLPLTSSQK